MNKNMENTISNRQKNTKTSGDDYIRELERIAENTIKWTSPITYYYANRESNTLKNVIISQIMSLYTPYHNHDFFEINYCLKDRLYEHVGGKSLILNEGDLLIMSPKIHHACFCEENALCYNILFRASWLQNIAKSFESYDPGNYLTSLINNEIYTIISRDEHTPFLNELFKKINEQSLMLNHHVDLYENIDFENHASEFLLALTKCQRHEYSNVSEKQKRGESHTPDDIIRYINDNFDRINLADTAARFGYSRCQFHRIISKKTGLSFSQIILNMRMHRARHYLLNTTLPIKSIAYLLGLDSAEHFSRMFKKHRKMSPTDYRKAFMRPSLQNDLKTKK